MSRLPLQPLQGFVLAARRRNLSRAAEALNLTVSALSHQIRALEERLQQRLFDAVAGPFDAIERALRPGHARRDDVLTISLLPSMASSWLVPRLPSFLSAHPQLQFNLQSSIELVDFERDTGVDAALRYGAGHWPGLTATHLFDEWIAPLAHPRLVAMHGGDTPHELSRYPLLEDDAGRWPEWFATHGGQAPKRFVAHFDDAEALHRAAAAGLGVAMGRMTLAKPLIEAGLLVALSPLRLKAARAHYLVHPARSDGHAGLSAFRAWLSVQAGDYALALIAPDKATKKQSARKSRRGAAPRG